MIGSAARYIDRLKPSANGIVRDAATAAGVQRWLWRGTSLCLGIAAGILLTERDLTALLWSLALFAGVLAWAFRASRPADRGVMLAIAALALSARFAIAALVHALSPAYGGGFITGDDAAYFRLASHAAGYLRGDELDPAYGPPDWGGERYLFGAYVYIETLAFLVFGPNVLLVIFLNAAMAVGSSLIVYRIAAQRFAGGAAIAAGAIIAFYPSAMVWSSLNLKDALTVVVMVTALYSLTRLQVDLRLLWVLMSLALAEMLTGMRGYVAATVAGTVPVTTATLRLPAMRRASWVAIAGALAGAIVVQTVTAIGASGPDQLLALLEQTRHAMAVDARTAFVDPPESYRIIAPAEVPIALAHVLFAPFPWMARRLADFAVIPEMFLWYALLLGAAITVWRERTQWRASVPALSISLGLLAVFVLAEGNTGTLLRHRGMLVPLVTLFASPTLTSLLARFRRR